MIDAGQIARDAGSGRADQHRAANLLLRHLRRPPARRGDRRRSRTRSRKTYGRRGAEVVARNHAAVDRALDGLHRVDVPGRVTSARGLAPIVPAHAPEFVRTVTAAMMAGRGDDLPVSALPVDGTYPSGTAAYEKRNISDLVAEWDPDLCIQCGNCSFVCPHSVIRSTLLRRRRGSRRRRPGSGRPRSTPAACPDTRLHAPGLRRGLHGLRAVRRGLPGLVARRPQPQGDQPCASASRSWPPSGDNIAFFETLPVADRSRVDFGTVRGTQFLEPLFEFSGACAGCGETPYLKLLSQLFGDRLMVANATGCSSIYGGNLPTTPWTAEPDGRGPAWSNSLFEDNAEFGLGLAAGRRPARRAGPAPARRAARRRSGAELADEILGAPQLRESELRGAARARRRAEAAAAGRSTAPAAADLLQRGRPPGPAQRLDRRRRRLGLRHRLRRPRPRARERAQRQRAGARHRGVLQHRRADVQGDAARRGRQVRRGRQDRAEEGPGAPGDRLRQRLRGPGGDGRRPAADASRVPRGRGLRRAVADHRLQPLHRPRHRHARRARPAVPGRGQRLLAADPLRPGGPRRRRQPVPARLAAAADAAGRLHRPASCATARWATPTRPRPNGWRPRPAGRRPALGRPTRRWPPGPAGSRDAGSRRRTPTARARTGGQ